ncbi:hypothetical protein GC106_35580 [Kibdelosporangium sp. 4NS15]|uniref:Uncharacterized protein n=1 Tax=Kibdelosporangium persicum TaxID=2698649 RepID=A0ABX2F4T5_9PSEU|nr:hypothetical protein [Kibdelosporangium persicum]NRN66336.1 hypothetical protein [Kibdelosporangium persicum]
MRLTKVAATVGVAVAMFLGAAATGSAAQNDYSKPMGPAPAKQDSGFSAQRTNGHSFWEVNKQGQLVYWTRSGDSYSGQIRGSGWDEAHTLQITALNENVFVELKADYRLSRWTWTGSGFIEEVVGTNWTPTRLLSGIDDNRFLEIKHDGQLVQWTFHGTTLAPYHLGVGWEAARLIAGLGGPEDHIIDFIEVGTDELGSVSNWFGVAGNLQEFPFGPNANFSDVRLIVGTDSYHFLIVPDDGTLWELAVDEAQNAWVGRQVGQGWDNSRLLG